MAIRPLNNQVLIELVDEYDGILRNTEDEQVQKGVVIEAGLNRHHLTASVGYDLGGTEDADAMMDFLRGKLVYWEEYSDTGKKFEFEGKRYSLVPYYRLIGYEE